MARAAGKAQLRAEHGTPADAFVVAVTFANYDGENRKSVTSRASPFARCATR